MNTRLLCSLAACVLVLAIQAPRAAAEYPGHEVWLGIGGATSSEKDIFNTPTDLESSPEVAISFGYAKNLDARRAVAFHVYGATETTPTVTLVGTFGSQDTQFDLYTYNVGLRYRHTFSRGGIAPYLFVGASYAFGSIESPPTGELTYGGVSACAGPGASMVLGKSFMLSAELFGSFGTASWEQQPFANSSSDEFNPSILGGTINIRLVWGWRQ